MESDRPADGVAPEEQYVDPLDRRSPKRKALAQISPVGDIEGNARRVVSAVLRVPVEIQDDGHSRSLVDLRIHYPALEPGFVEVVTDIDGSYAAMWSRVIGRDATVSVPEHGRVWWLTVSALCNVKKLHAEVPALVTMLTADGATFDHHTELPGLRDSTNPAVLRLIELGVVGLNSRPTKPDEHGEIRLHPQGISGPVDIYWPPILTWVNAVLASDALSDVRAKLAATTAAERHVFLGVTHTSPGEVFFALSHRQSMVPPKPPELPAEITHLWLMNVELIGRCLAWFPNLGWFDTRHPPAAD